MIRHHLVARPRSERAEALSYWRLRFLMTARHAENRCHHGVVNNDEAPPAGWAVLDHSYDDADLPAPFNAIGFDSNNIGASVWVYLPTGAMVAAIPTGLWKERAQFAFYYAAPHAKTAVPLQEWSDAQREWDGTDPNHYDQRHDDAIAYFNAMAGGRLG
ncbi:Uncharacterised protein [Mycobacteroides abscessus subsp. abscessus]|uniref:Uncharacterized protein n=1 Tax=Mycobacteroides abscessus subsp. abscessus TaxID=1185650 RepID=A0AB38D815_9MYCO|nr:hypothetical protein [Mycobacteroides abscessus]SHQ59149.1 Uncharacterised protein [Mycobacteroides abscessus subsp. abscessus]CPS24961.1 Uncharacterised protein [Mycobacteroides abscessus]CPS55305.1 Uncharacterised protein [Mycobacteroides abscessus]CPT38893.1 Uncharacterised protein [Mycobacteroides abscessus]